MYAHTRTHTHTNTHTKHTYTHTLQNEVEALMMEISICINDVTYCLDNLRDWMAPDYKPRGLANIGNKIYTQAEPYGVVLIIAPWNYPIQLTLLVLIGAIAAGEATQHVHMCRTCTLYTVHVIMYSACIHSMHL